MYFFSNFEPVRCSMCSSVASWPAYRFLRRQVKWSGTPISLRIFHSLLWSTQLKALGFSVLTEAEVVVFLEFPHFLYDPKNVGKLIFGFSALPKFSLYLWKILIHVLLKPSLKDFEHNLTIVNYKLALTKSIANDWTTKAFAICLYGFPGGSEVKASASNAGDLGSIPGLGRSPGEGNGNPLQCSCLENPMDGEAW